MPPPVELVRSAQQWLHARLDDGTFECVYGMIDFRGLSVGTADSVESQMDLMLDYPLSPFVEFEVHPLVGVDDFFERFVRWLERAGAQMPQGA